MVGKSLVAVVEELRPIQAGGPGWLGRITDRQRTEAWVRTGIGDPQGAGGGTPPRPAHRGALKARRLEGRRPARLGVAPAPNARGVVEGGRARLEAGEQLLKIASQTPEFGVCAA